MTQEEIANAREILEKEKQERIASAHAELNAFLIEWQKKWNVKLEPQIAVNSTI